MSINKAIYIATTNIGKLQEYVQLLAPISCNKLPENIEPPNENAATFIENALIKARYYSNKLNNTVLADDSGLVIPVLDGRPGVYSARFAGENATNDDNISKLLKIIENISQPINAFFYCAIVIMKYPNDPAPLIGTGKIDGIIIKKPRGTNGFGYDPIFYLPSLGKTMAELSKQEKNVISHRAIAFRSIQGII